MKEGFIYTLSDPRTEIVKYVGQTTDLNKRYNLHLYHSKNGRCRTHKEKWINALINESVKPAIDVIWQGDILLLDKKETEFIALFKSFGSKLTNATFGGLTTRGRKCSEETKEKMRALMLGRCLRPPITEAEKIATSIRSKGVRPSLETRRKISESRKGKYNNQFSDETRKIAAKNSAKATSKSVIAIKDGVEQFYPSQIEAERQTGVDRKTMRGVLNGTYKQSKGFTFKNSNNEK